jgi:hypothetical protein
LKNRILLENYYLLGELEREIGATVTPAIVRKLRAAQSVASEFSTDDEQIRARKTQAQARLGARLGDRLASRA